MARAIGWKSKPLLSLLAVYMCLLALAFIAILGVILFIDSQSEMPAEPQYPARAGVVAAQSRTLDSGYDRATFYFLVEVTSWDVANKGVGLTITCEVDESRLSGNQRAAFRGEGLPVLIDGFAAAQTFVVKAFAKASHQVRLVPWR